MPRFAGDETAFTIGTTPFVFGPRTLEGLPEAPRFVEYLLGRKIAPHTAKLYAVHVARLRRQDKLGRLDLVSDRTARTAANAFHTWRRDRRKRAYEVLRHAMPTTVRDHLDFVRISSCVAAYPEKRVPQERNWSNTDTARVQIDTTTKDAIYLDALPWAPCDVPTLHVPHRLLPPHTDPCDACAVVRLTQEQIDAIMEAVEMVWGHRDMSAIPRNALLLGDVDEAQDIIARAVRVVGLSEATQASIALLQVKAAIEHTVDEFLAQLQSGAQAVFLSREACGDRLFEVLHKLEEVWSRAV